MSQSNNIMKATTPKTPAYLILCLSVALSACNKNTDDIGLYIETTKAKHIGSVKPIPQFKPYENFVYSAHELRDPFTPNQELEDEGQQTSNGLRPDSVRPKQALELFPLDTLSMVGTLEQGDQVWALVKDPKNAVHRIQPGQYLGENEGRITAISETDISLVEIVPDGLGGYIERNASIAIGNE